MGGSLRWSLFQSWCARAAIFRSATQTNGHQRTHAAILHDHTQHAALSVVPAINTVALGCHVCILQHQYGQVCSVSSLWFCYSLDAKKLNNRHVTTAVTLSLATTQEAAILDPTTA